jgi:hypothetical protein
MAARLTEYGMTASMSRKGDDAGRKLTSKAG